MASHFDRERFSLHTDYDTGRVLLFESHTEQRKLLPAGVTWALDYSDADGVIVKDIHQNVESFWADDVLDHTVICKTVGERNEIEIDLGGEEDLITIAEYVQLHQPVDYNVVMSGHQDPVRMAGLRMAHMQGGCFFYWNLADIYSKIVPKSAPHRTCPSTWYTNGSRTWPRLLSDVGVDPAIHFRKPSETAASTKNDDGLYLRFVPAPIASTDGLLRILSRCAADSKSTVKKNKGLQQDVRLFLEGLITTHIAPASQVEWTL